MIAGDASGGPDTAEPELRQEGLGLAHFDEKGLEQLGSLAVALASHEPQMAGYGELMVVFGDARKSEGSSFLN